VSTVTQKLQPESAIWDDERGVIRDVSWGFYDRLSNAIETGSIRMAYDGKDIEIMTLGPLHEGISGLLKQFVDLVIDGLAIDCVALGGTTWKRPEAHRGIESDQCYIFDPERINICRAALRRRSNDVADYPNPEMAVEIDISEPLIDRPGIYAMLNVFEVWRFQGDGGITIEGLAPDGKYTPAESSRFLAVRPGEVQHWLEIGNDMERREWRRQLKEWVAREVRPRLEARS
jgi:Uma2 family endonuclease